MRYFIKSILLYIPVSCLAYILLVCLWGELVPTAFTTNLSREDRSNNTSLRLHDVRNFTDIDILFLGSSRAYSSFDTRMYEELGYTAFNLGTSAQTPLQTKVLLDRYLDKLEPELIIYELSPSMFASDGIESATDIIANGKCDIHALKMGIKTKHVKVFNTMIFSLYTQIVKGEKEIEPGLPKKNERYIKGGFIETEQMEFEALKLASIPRVEQMNHEQVAAFESILAMTESKNIQLILLQIPFTPAKYESLHAINPVFDREMKLYGEYYNLNESMHLTDTVHFRDEHHLNLNGLRILNKTLIDLLHL